MLLSLRLFFCFSHVFLRFLEGLEVAVPDVRLYLGGHHPLGRFCLSQGSPLLQQTNGIIVLFGLLFVLRRKRVVVELPLLQFEGRLEMASFATIAIIQCCFCSLHKRIRPVSAWLFLLIAGLIL